MKIYLCIAGPVMATVLAACGSTTVIKPTREAEATIAAPEPKGKATLDLAGYDKVVVLDFVDAVDKTKIKPADLRAYSDTVATATHTFPDLIAQKLRDTGAYREVVRGPSPGKAVVISGRITRLTEGNSALRLFVGMGAGSAYFDATTDLADAESGSSLGEVATNKNSWVLGGGFAAGQSVQSFMEGAAEKIAQDLHDGKARPTVAKVH